ncbi:DUF418 domain-containing protein [Gracilibacillus alcaliphilus]|uniref:DUF418 domain-containing protein n=1 Tax=Gracilibacillus alcaliphilus TaxID=1401441 RepID=UPI00195637D6|nr:DUF418 domain-containing protein [Gracilibacillus alcaliphilus]MBM7675777.1 uncharacterized protein [Gracilibacillus alcaliphilus]
MQSLPANQRVKLLDIVRGLALLGILLINMRFFTTSLQTIQFQLEVSSNWWDQTAQTLLDFFVAGKFIAIFAFLFGYGMMLMKDSAVKRGYRFVPLYSRRLLALLLFGLIHGWFIWYGDILLHYALLGFILLLFYKRKARTLLVWSILLLLFIPGIMLLSGTDGSYEPSPEWMEQVQQWITEDEVIYSSGSWTEIQSLRIRDWNSSLLNQIIFYPQILGLFLLGVYFAKKRWFQHVTENRATLRKICWWTGGVGFLSHLIPVSLKLFSWGTETLLGQLELFQHLLGSPLIGVFYILLVALLIQKKTWEVLLNPLANVGRMAFTNYIMQSVICTLIFYGYGFGWFGKVGPAIASLIAITIFVVQIVYSMVWFRYFRIGPLEWLWRWITYLSLPAWKVKPSSGSIKTGKG